AASLTSGVTSDAVVSHHSSELASAVCALSDSGSSGKGWRESRYSPVSAVNGPPTRMIVCVWGCGQALAFIYRPVRSLCAAQARIFCDYFVAPMAKWIKELDQFRCQSCDFGN